MRVASSATKISNTKRATFERANERTNERTDERTNERTNERGVRSQREIWQLRSVASSESARVSKRTTASRLLSPASRGNNKSRPRRSNDSGLLEFPGGAEGRASGGRASLRISADGSLRTHQFRYSDVHAPREGTKRGCTRWHFLALELASTNTQSREDSLARTWNASRRTH